MDRWAAPIRDGNREAFADMVRTLYPRLVAYAVGLVGSRADAEDIVQDVLGAVWKNHKSFAPHTSTQIYLYRAVRNRCINASRRRRTTPASSAGTSSGEGSALDHIATAEPLPDHDARYAELLGAYHQAIDSLPDGQRSVFSLCRIHGLTYDEAALVLNVSVNTVRTQLMRAQRVIRAALSDYR